MILQINQVTANGANNFEIFENGALLYKGFVPFYKPTVPVGGDTFRRLTLTDVNDSEILYTHYDTAENLAASVVPPSLTFGDSRQVRIYRIVDNNGHAVGAFYYEQSGAADRKLVAQYGGKTLACYLKEAGKKEIVSVYSGETQVGQITKPNCVFDHLDQYLAHFTDDFSDAKIVSLFVIYYDYLFHNHSGEIAKGWYANKEYTFDKNSKKYNKKFIAGHFGMEEDARVEQFIRDTYAARKRK